MSRFVFAHSQQEYLLAHALCRVALSAATGVAAHAWRFVRDARGKPEVAAPTVPWRIRFNLSHTRGMAACIVTRDVDCGVDVEWVGQKRDFGGLASVALAPTERQALLGLPPGAQAERFYTHWTLKEAYVKARGLGLSVNLRAVDMGVDASGVVRARFAPELGDTPETWHFALHAPQPQHLLAVAVRSPTASVRVQWHTPSLLLPEA